MENNFDEIEFHGLKQLCRIYRLTCELENEECSAQRLAIPEQNEFPNTPIFKIWPYESIKFAKLKEECKYTNKK